MNGARCADSPGRVVSFGQVIIDLTIRVGRVPQPGEDVYADRAGVAVGAGFNALYAVRRMGVDAVYAGRWARVRGRTGFAPHWSGRGSPMAA